MFDEPVPIHYALNKEYNIVTELLESLLNLHYIFSATFLFWLINSTIISSRAGELINEVSLAMKHGISLEGIGRNIHPYPTTGESIMACGLQLINSKWKTLD